MSGENFKPLPEDELADSKESYASTTLSVPKEGITQCCCNKSSILSFAYEINYFFGGAVSFYTMARITAAAVSATPVFSTSEPLGQFAYSAGLAIPQLN